MCFGMCACDFGGSSSPGVGLENVNQAAPRLEEVDENGIYRPYYSAGDMQRPRYLHETVFLRSGLLLAFSGTDERGLTAIENVEFYDQSRFDKDEVRPETITGVWFDTDFEGDPMIFETGPRLWFTADELADGRVIIIGGASNILAGPTRARAEVFDPSTRAFETVEDEMIEPRFRHTTALLSDGSLLVIGGQTLTTITVVEELFFANVQTTITVFPSTPNIEIYSPTENTFEPFTLENSGRDVTLATPRGRSGHALGRLAGPDERLGSANDVLLVVGGYQTLSPQFAPVTKLWGRVGSLEADALKSLEFYDAQSKVFIQVSNVSLDNGRVDSPAAMNLGQFNDFTTDGLPGMSNMALITHGNTDSGCPDTISNVINKVLASSFTGFGPAQGLQFFHVQELENNSHVQSNEYSSELSPVPPAPGLLPPGPFPLGLWIERAGTNPIAMPRRLRTAENLPDVGTWIIALAGVHIYPTPAGCAFVHSTEVLDAGTIFDPFYSLSALQLGLSPRQLSNTRTRSNPTGVVGSWLIADGAIPTATNDEYGTTFPITRWGRKIANARVYHETNALPGEDGLIGSPDDRVFLSGGGTDYGTFGDEPTAPSSEVWLPPRVNDPEPSP